MSATTGPTTDHLLTGTEHRTPVAIVTGGSRGLGRALVSGLLGAGWSVVTDGRNRETLDATARELAPQDGPALVALPGDVAVADHRAALLEAADELGGVDLLVLNAGILGPSPLPKVGDLGSDDLTRVLVANAVAPHALARDALPRLRERQGTIIVVTSDAAAEAYEGWGAYGASKAALEHLARVLAEEEPAVTVHRVDPGDLRTDMHQEAFPGEDISDRPEPAAAVPGFLALLDRPPRSGGRWRAEDLAPASDGEEVRS